MADADISCQAEGDVLASDEELLSKWEDCYGNIEENLVAGWVRHDPKYRLAREYGEERASSATTGCLVADPRCEDCPLVYATAGLADVLGASRAEILRGSLGALRELDLDVNKSEAKRLHHFCRASMSDRRIVMFIMGQTSSGEFFWSFFCLKDMQFTSRTQGSTSYILGIHQKVVIHQQIMSRLMDCMAGDQWCLGHLEKLRGILREHEADFNPLKQSTVSLMVDCLDQWILQSIGPEIDRFWEGTHYVPVVGETGTDVLMGKWPVVMSTMQDMMKRLFHACESVLDDTRHNRKGSIICAVSDPSRMDCPLVYVSRAFEDVTGYDCSFAVGRNCRFLQPKIVDVNHMVNDDEMARMRKFCSSPMAAGSTILNMLLNETLAGMRFWNLLLMRHAYIDGHPYILAVQTVLDLPMPRVLRTSDLTRMVLEYDECFFDRFLENARDFLRGLRGRIRVSEALDGEGMMVDLAGESRERILRFIRDFSDDYEGDQHVPRTSLKEAIEFEVKGTRRLIQQMVQKELADVGVALDSELSYSITDLQMEDAPLLYVSRGFERLSGYRHEWALGRNGRFLLPKDAARDRAFNGAELARVAGFCSLPPKPGRLVALLVSETHCRCLFWNLVVVQHLRLDGKLYVLSVQTAMTALKWKTCELFGLDPELNFEIERLRSVVSDLAVSLGGGAGGGGGLSLSSLAERAVMAWQCRVAPELFLPRTPVCPPAEAAAAAHPSAPGAEDPGGLAGGQGLCIPVVGIQLLTTMAKPETERVLVGALEEGIRHFQIAFPPPGDIAGGDQEYQDLEGLHYSLKLAEVFEDLKKHQLQSLKPALVFTIRTPPCNVETADKILNVISAAGSSVACWFLDVFKSPDKLVVSCWERLAGLARGAGISTLGLAGASAEKLLRLKEACGSSRGRSVSAFLFQDHSHKCSAARTNEVHAHEKLLSLRGSGVLLMAGIDSACPLPTQEKVRLAAETLRVDPAIVLTKWAQARGYAAVVLPQLRAPGGPDSSPPGGGGTPSSKAPGAVHRTFVRRFYGAPGPDKVSELLNLHAGEPRYGGEEAVHPPASVVHTVSSGGARGPHLSDSLLACLRKDQGEDTDAGRHSGAPARSSSKGASTVCTSKRIWQPVSPHVSLGVMPHACNKAHPGEAVPLNNVLCSISTPRRRLQPVSPQPHPSTTQDADSQAGQRSKSKSGNAMSRSSQPISPHVVPSTLSDACVHAGQRRAPPLDRAGLEASRGNTPAVGDRLDLQTTASRVCTNCEGHSSQAFGLLDSLADTLAGSDQVAPGATAPSSNGLSGTGTPRRCLQPLNLHTPQSATPDASDHAYVRRTATPGRDDTANRSPECTAPRASAAGMCEVHACVDEGRGTPFRVDDSERPALPPPRGDATAAECHALHWCIQAPPGRRSQEPRVPQAPWPSQRKPTKERPAPWHGHSPTSFDASAVPPAHGPGEFLKKPRPHKREGWNA